MFLAQLSDPHLRDDGRDPAHDPAAALRQAFARIRALPVLPDAILLSGDIIDRSARGYDHVLPLLREAPVPVLPMPGNHDRKDQFRAAFGGWADYAPDHLGFCKRIGGAELIAMDSTLANGMAGLEAPALDWLERRLAVANAPVVLALHHPPFKTGLPYLDEAGFAGAGRLENTLGGAAVIRILSGHTHRPIFGGFAGIPASTAPALGHGLSLALQPGGKALPIAAPPGFDLHLLLGKTLVSHRCDLATD